MIEEKPSQDSQHETSTDPKHVGAVPPAPAKFPFPEETKKDMSEFERKMLRVTRYGIAVAGITGLFIYLQFREAAKQSNILGEQARQAAADSAESGKRLERQLTLSEQQTRAAQDNVEAIRKQMRQDQRAWIKMDQTEQVTLTEGQPFMFNLHLANIGKTAARNLITEVIVEKLSIESEPSLSFKKGIARTSATVGAMFPNDPNIAVQGFWQRDVPGTDKVESILPSRTDVQEFTDGNTYFVLYARTKYADIFNKSHLSKFCRFYATNTKSLTVPARRCTDYNGVDNN